MNKKITDYVIDLVEVLNKQQKQIFWGFFDIASMVLSIIVSYILFYGLINPAPVDYVIYTGLTFLFYQLMIGFWGLNASISRYSKITDFMKIFFGVTISSILSYVICQYSSENNFTSDSPKIFLATLFYPLYRTLYPINNILDSTSSYHLAVDLLKT